MSKFKVGDFVTCVAADDDEVADLEKGSVYVVTASLGDKGHYVRVKGVDSAKPIRAFKKVDTSLKIVRVDENFDSSKDRSQANFTGVNDES